MLGAPPSVHILPLPLKTLPGQVAQSFGVCGVRDEKQPLDGMGVLFWVSAVLRSISCCMIQKSSLLKPWPLFASRSRILGQGQFQWEHLDFSLSQAPTLKASQDIPF